MSYDWIEVFDCRTLPEVMGRILELTAEEVGRRPGSKQARAAALWNCPKHARAAALLVAVTQSVNQIMREEGMLHIAKEHRECFVTAALLRILVNTEECPVSTTRDQVLANVHAWQMKRGVGLLATLAALDRARLSKPDWSNTYEAARQMILDMESEHMAEVARE